MYQLSWIQIGGKVFSIFDQNNFEASFYCFAKKLKVGWQLSWKEELKGKTLLHCHHMPIIQMIFQKKNCISNCRILSPKGGRIKHNIGTQYSTQMTDSCEILTNTPLPHITLWYVTVDIHDCVVCLNPMYLLCRLYACNFVWNLIP